MNLIGWYRDQQRRRLVFETIISTVKIILSTVQRLEKSMSALTDAVDALTAAKAEEGSELKLVLEAVAAFPSKIIAAVDAAIAAGADPATLTAITTATAELAAEHQAMVDALNATPPAAATPVTPPTPAAPPANG